jgi:hypothetical protein
MVAGSNQTSCGRRNLMIITELEAPVCGKGWEGGCSRARTWPAEIKAGIDGYAATYCVMREDIQYLQIVASAATMMK